MEKAYKCGVCGKEFVQKRNFNKHTKIHTAVKSHTCNVCGKAFTQKSTCDRHTKTHTGEKPFNCNFCLKNLHTNVHVSNTQKSIQRRNPILVMFVANLSW